MMNSRLRTRRVKNASGNVEIINVDLSLLGSKKYPIMVFRGEKNESRSWCATFLKLPGYLGLATTEAEAITKLWAMSDQGPIYDVSKCRGLDPTAENIQKLLIQARRDHAASQSVRASGNRNYEAMVAIAKEHSLSVNTLKPALTRGDTWESLGGLNLAVSKLRLGHRVIASVNFKDMESTQAYLEDNPERARLVLARRKFPAHNGQKA
jgi:hypothetical protein